MLKSNHLNVRFPNSQSQLGAGSSELIILNICLIISAFLFIFLFWFTPSYSQDLLLDLYLARVGEL